MSRYDNIAELFKTQQSLTEWLEDIKHTKTADIRNEDNTKRERLGVLNGVIGLPYDKPTQFEAADVREENPEFAKYLQKNKSELCALRLLPKQQDLPKLRTRGLTVEKALQWFKEQNIDTQLYKADFIPHPPDDFWSTIFIVNEYGIQGEIIYGGHRLLTQGFHEDKPPIVFRYDYNTWTMYPENADALDHLKKIITYIHVPNKKIQKQLHNTINAQFEHDYITGYFETTDSSLGLWFIDYNQSLGALYNDVKVRTHKTIDAKARVTGQTGCGGIAEGVVHIVSANNLDVDFPEGAILVCEVTTPLFVPLMQKAAAIVTDKGGILSHAAIVARELKKPCIVGTGNATKILQNGKKITVNADIGSIY